MAAIYGKTGSDAEGGKYRPLIELGQGGTANVFLAVAQGPSGFNKLVVLKALKSSLASDPEFPRMFLNEARLAARLNHPNVVQTYEVFEENGLPIIVMEYLEGQPLSSIVSRADAHRPLTLPMHLRIIAETLSGLHYSHELTDFDGSILNVVHRDMTPHNIFVTFDGQVKVLDFGIAKLSGSMVETQTGVIKGKLRYMPPEQLTGEKVDRRTDIFAVGVMIWEAATGQKMWKGLAETVIMTAVVKGEIPSPRTVRPDVPERLEQIIMKALAYNKEDRYATAAELQGDIEELLAASPASGREIGKYVSSIFQDVRAETKRIIEKQLSTIASLSSADYADAGETVTLPSTLSLTRATYSSSSSSRQVLRSQPPARNRRTAALVGGTAIVLVLLGLFWKRQNAVPEPVPSIPSAAAVTPPPVETAAAPKVNRITFRAVAFPEEAKLFLDDVPLPSNPYSATVSQDGTRHVVRGEASGYTSESLNVTFDQGSDLTLNLKRSKHATPVVVDRGHKAVVVAPPPATSVARPPPPPDNKPNCSPPYFVDEKGIKKFKPECM